MSIFPIILMFFGILAMSGAQTAQKAIANKKTLTAGQMVMVQQFLSAMTLFILMLFWDQGNLAPKTNLFWIAVCVTGGVNIFIQYANTRAKQLADNSLIAPIQAVTPGIVTVAALILHEVPSTIGIIGIVLISIGTFIHNREGAKTLSDWIQPFTALALPRNYETLSPEEQEAARNRRNALRWSYGSAGAGTIGLIFDGLTARNGNPALGFALISTIIFTFFLITVNKKDFGNITHTIKTSKWLVIGSGIMYGLHGVLIGTAFRFAPVAYIGSLKRLSILVTVLMAYYFLSEKKALKRIWPALIIAAGAMMLSFDPSIGKIISKTSNLFGF